jgi:hypothetical protein
VAHNDIDASKFAFNLIYYFCQLFMVIIAATILIKHVFDVMNKNKEVMTLFAMIEKEQIEKLKLECEDFRRNHLAEISFIQLGSLQRILRNQ